jgi:hypothetical protein
MMPDNAFYEHQWCANLGPLEMPLLMFRIMSTDPWNLVSGIDIFAVDVH